MDATLELRDPVSRVIRDYWHGRAVHFDAGDWQVNRDPGTFERWRDVYREALGPTPLRVLDVGSGTGEVVFLLRGLGHEAEGADFSPGMLALSREKARERDPRARFTEAEATRLPFPDGTFDAVHARMIIWTLPDRAGALREWVRVLKPGGRLVCVEGTWYPPGLRDRVRRAIGKAIEWVASLASRRPGRGPRHPFLPFHVEVARDLYPGRDVLPFLWGVHRGELEGILREAGLSSVVSLDLRPLRARQRASLPWWRRLTAPPLQDASAGWGAKPAVPRREPSVTACAPRPAFRGIS